MNFYYTRAVFLRTIFCLQKIPTDMRLRDLTEKCCDGFEAIVMRR